MDGARWKILADNLKRVRDRIISACAHVGREPTEVKLIAVTKSVGPEVIQMLIDQGAKHIGENRLQDAKAKFRQVPALRNRKPGGGEVTTHFIGHLQTNKVKGVLDLFDVIHSVDSVELAKEIDKRAALARRIVPCFVEINVSGEVTKEGMAVNEAEAALPALLKLPHIEWAGLMTMAPNGVDELSVRSVFRELHNCATTRFNTSSAVRLENLSMGMSNDFEIAIEEGATHVRIGTALFEGL